MIKTADRLDPSGEFTEFMKEFIEKKLFGKVNYMDKNTFHLTASFEFHSGMCKKFDLVKYMGDTHTHMTQTILNDKIDFRKK